MTAFARLRLAPLGRVGENRCRAQPSRERSAAARPAISPRAFTPNGVVRAERERRLRTKRAVHLRGQRALRALLPSGLGSRYRADPPRGVLEGVAGDVHLRSTARSNRVCATPRARLCNRRCRLSKARHRRREEGRGPTVLSGRARAHERPRATATDRYALVWRRGDAASGADGNARGRAATRGRAAR